MEEDKTKPIQVPMLSLPVDRLEDPAGLEHFGGGQNQTDPGSPASLTRLKKYKHSLVR